MKIIIRLLGIFTNKDKVFFTFLIFGSFLGMILEVFSLGSVIPAISILLQDDITSIKYLSFLNLEELISDFKREYIITLGLIIVLSIFLLKNLFIGILFYFQNKFSHYFVSKIQSKLYNIYINKNYEFHLSMNSAIILRNLTTECARLLSTLLQILILITETIILIGVVSLVLFVDFRSALIISSFLILFVIFYQFVLNKQILNFGKTRLKLSGEINKNILQTFSSIKEIKISQKENFFLNLFKENIFRVAYINIIYKTLLNFPRLLLEIICLSGIIFLISTMLYSGKTNIQIIEILGFYIVIAFRTIPGASKLIAALQNLKFDSSSIETILNHLESEYFKKNYNFSKIKQIDLSKMPYNIELKELNFKFKGKDNFVLKKINLNIEKGDYIGILGPSGSGKSTLLNIIMGLLTNYTGSLNLYSNSMSLNNINYQTSIGYVPQDIYLMDDTIEKNIAFGIKNNDIDHIKMRNILINLNLIDFIDSLPKGINTNIGERGIKISGGQLQRISIARALYRDPEILILDEATSSLDTENENIVTKSLKSFTRKKTIISVSHKINSIKDCNKILKIDNGEIIHFESKALN